MTRSEISDEIDFLRYYDLEAYLFEDVHIKFHKQGCLSAFDFFAIVIWKANRAKTLVARRLLTKAQTSDLNTAVENLSKSLFKSETHRERLRILMEEWGFHLPMASAILTVLWPDAFTVYDVRACDQLDRFHKLANWTQFDRVWSTYEEFRDAVIAAGPTGLSLREKDKYLWGRSSASQLQQDIARCFIKIE
jgi:hypothetical protein